MHTTPSDAPVRPHILIIDDDPDIRELFALLLGEAGYSVDTAACGPDGLAALAARRPACVLLDVNMPAMSGWDVFRRLKSDPATARIPVIIQTVRCQLPDQEEAHQAAPDGVIIKPFDIHHMVDIVAAALAKAAG